MDYTRLETVFLEIPNLTRPKLISGLPGSGYVGKIAVDYLIEKLNAKKFAEIYSNSFPPQVSVSSDGTVDLSKTLFYSCRSGSSDLVLLTGDSQPVSAEGVYMLAEAIIAVCRRLGVPEIYTLAAYITGKFSAKPEVYGTATTFQMIARFKQKQIKTLDHGTITGMNGVLVGTAKKYSLNASCLMGETSGFVLDALASKAVLICLSSLVGLDIDVTDLEKRVKETEKSIKELQSKSDQKPAEANQFSQSNLGYIS